MLVLSSVIRVSSLSNYEHIFERILIFLAEHAVECPQYRLRKSGQSDNGLPPTSSGCNEQEISVAPSFTLIQDRPSVPQPVNSFDAPGISQTLYVTPPAVTDACYSAFIQPFDVHPRPTDAIQAHPANMHPYYCYIACKCALIVDPASSSLTSCRLFFTPSRCALICQTSRFPLALSPYTITSASSLSHCLCFIVSHLPLSIASEIKHRVF